MGGRARGVRKRGGAAQPLSSGSIIKRSRHTNAQARSVRPKKRIDDCKVFVSNLAEKVTERMLHFELSVHADVEKVTFKKNKTSKNSNGCAVVKVLSKQDAQKLLTLHTWDRELCGQIFTITGAKNSIKLPGDDGYVRLPLSVREFELASPDPEQPSIHMLVDDIVLKVFSYLPLKYLLTCERVCRRWQMLLHQYFSSKTNLELSEAILGIPYPLAETIIPKLLMLTGPSLRSLKMQEAKLIGRRNILKIIAELCPQLEYLDVSKSEGIDFNYIEELSDGCENIKGFVARECMDFRKRSLQLLLDSFPQLEKLDVLDTMVPCRDYEALPSTLKELHIDIHYDDPDGEQPVTMIADMCPNLEALTLREWVMSATTLKYIGKKCNKLTKLTLYLDSSRKDKFTKALVTFQKLKELEVFTGTLDLTLLFKSLSQLEVLTLYGIYGSKDVDFSVLKKLKSLKHGDTQLTEASLKTVSKCAEFEKILIDSLSEELVVDLLEACPKLKAMTCPRVVLSRSLITKVDQIMKGRPGKVHIELGDKNFLSDSAQYDRDKITFVQSKPWDDSSDSENSLFDSSDSDDSIAPPWLF